MIRVTSGVLLAALAARAEPYRPVTSGPLVSFTAPLTAPGALLVQPIGSFALSAEAFDAAGRRTSAGAVGVTSALSLFLAAGLHHRLELGAQLTVVQAERLREAVTSASAGFGDTTLFARTPLLAERSFLPEVTAVAQVKLPTGSATAAPGTAGPLGSGTVDLAAGVNLTRGLAPCLLHADVTALLPLEGTVDGVRTRYGPGVAWSLAAELPFAGGLLGTLVELSGRHQGGVTLDGVAQADTAAHELVAGAGVELLLAPWVQVLVGYQRTLWGRNVAAVDAMVLTIAPTFQLL